MSITGDGGDQPKWTWRDREDAARSRGIALDPAAQPAGDPTVYPTVYQPDVLLVRVAAQNAVNVFQQINDRAVEFGWVVIDETDERSAVEAGSRRSEGRTRRRTSAAETRRARIQVLPEAPVDPEVPVDPEKPSTRTVAPIQRPDAWRLVREARRASIPGVSLNHVLSIDPIGVNPFKAYPFKAYPFKAYPFKAYGGIDSYASPGFGGRQPVSFAGPALADGAAGNGLRRPVVAVLDTGLGEHAWIPTDAVVRIDDPGGDDAHYAGIIGVDDPKSDPELHPSLGDPLDGVLDPAAGHGTFIAGIIRQVCPHARILPIRVSDGQGVILEDVLLDALGVLLDALKNGAKIDVLNLSFGFYHESADASTVDGELYDLLFKIRQEGCVVVCSAGNEATDRPTAPASLYAWPDNDYQIAQAAEASIAPHVAVGALNPSNRSVAMFSNVGPWVSTYAPGVSIVSTLPSSFRGSLQADLSVRDYDRWRETLDIDDFGSGFAVWSGTSFAAPLVAGLIAKELVPTLTAGPTVAGEPHADLAAIVEKVVGGLAAQDASSSPQKP